MAEMAPWLHESHESHPPHSHCETCIKVLKCTVRTPRPGESCQVVSCIQGCGSKFHSCKSSEHRLLCPEEKVPCINAGNGCPLWLLRKHRSRHLERCPASVVHCTMEWNRWPVSPRERLVNMSYGGQQTNALTSGSRVGQVSSARPGQLDVALALRDQRMLNEWTKVPAKTERAMKNDLTRKLPAAPFAQRYRTNEGPSSPVPAEGEEPGGRGQCNNGPLEYKRSPPGLQRSMCLELYRASVKDKRAISRAGDKVNNPFLNNWPLLEPMDFESVSGGMNMVADKMDVEPEQEDEGVVLDVAEYDVLFVDNTVVSEISSASMTDHARKIPSPPQVQPPPPPPPLFLSLGLDLTLESITRYQTKPPSMYTFLCAQVFRRDEYCWHYKNVHSDIHGGLNGWLEQRCPLAHHGCMFSVRRFFPACRGSTVVHNDILESFGVRPNVKYHEGSGGSGKEQGACGGRDAPRGNGEELALTRLPFEVLQHVARCLDSFSLCNLSMTSRLLREVACSLLEERGVVVQQWERRRNKYSPGAFDGWHVAYKRWFFSTAFSPVHSWAFEEKENMGNHLKNCMYFQRNVKTDPYYYPMGTEPNQELYEKLKANARIQQESKNMSVVGSTKI